MWLYDTATAQVRPLELRDPGRVSMYVCGPSVYDVPHLGHGRFALVYDVLRRYLEFCGYSVDYVSNITDIEDKLIERAKVEGRSVKDLASFYERRWWQAMDALEVKRPSEAPHATEYVAQMVSLVADLVQRGVAYETSEGVYFSVDKVPDYGLLARQVPGTLRAGARVEPGAAKRAPLDFALWKKAKPGEPTWPSPWGDGRPGWHTECAVMSLQLLGEDFDIHGGGIDLAFPHHENERAQLVALGQRPARHWVHSGWVVDVKGEKMSKSGGNFISLQELLEQVGGRSYRLLVLRSHYRSPLEVTRTNVTDARAALERLDALARRFGLPGGLAAMGLAEAEAADMERDALRRFVEAMDSDLDTSAALAGIFELTRRSNAAADAGDDASGRRLAATVAVLCGALGLRLRRHEERVDPDAAALLAARERARAEKDWRLADTLRVELSARGWMVEDPWLAPGRPTVTRRAPGCTGGPSRQPISRSDQRERALLPRNPDEREQPAKTRPADACPPALVATCPRSARVTMR